MTVELTEEERDTIIAGMMLMLFDACTSKEGKAAADRVLEKLGLSK